MTLSIDGGEDNNGHMADGYSSDAQLSSYLRDQQKAMSSDQLTAHLNQYQNVAGDRVRPTHRRTPSQAASKPVAARKTQQKSIDTTLTPVSGPLHRDDDDDHDKLGGAAAAVRGDEMTSFIDGDDSVVIDVQTAEDGERTKFV